MDPVSALAFAGNILQFVQFGGEVIVKAREVYKSEHGALTENVELENKTKQLTSLCKTMKQDLNLSDNLCESNRDQSSIGSENVVRQIAASCVTTGQEIMDLLGLLKTDRKSLLAVAKTSLKAQWHKDKLSKLKASLEKAQNDLMLHLIADLGKGLKEMQIFFGSALLQQTDDLRNVMSSFRDSIKAVKIQEPRPDELDDLSRKLLKIHILDKNLKLEKAFMMDLDLPALRERHNRIKDAHSDTFEWAFTKETSSLAGQNSFSRWLRSGNGLYWVTGKPGSGKSTFMKNVAQHKETFDMLWSWSKPQELVLASFYFWISGSPIQRSFHGLLRSLFHAILQSDPKLISQLFHWRWNMYKLHGSCTEAWTDVELMEAVKLLKSGSVHGKKFCLFIDSLDEYDDRHKDLIQFINELSKAQNIKLCVSSRSWIVFQDAWGSGPTLRMQDLTDGDIQKYATDELAASLPWRRYLDQQPHNAQKLVLDIVERSLGVFLWVYLVIESLKEGLSNGDSFTLLRIRLDEMPADLDELFTYMLSKIEKIYLKDAKRLFWLAIQSRAPLLLLTYSYLDETGVVTNFGEQALIKEVERLEIVARADETKRRLKSRCRGLLEVHTQGKTGQKFTDVWDLPDELHAQAYTVKVGFLHRSVRDFLGTSGARLILSGIEDSLFDTSYFILQAILAEIKGLSRLRAGVTRREAFETIFAQGTPYLKENLLQDCDTPEPSITYFDELDRAASTVIDDNSEIITWTRVHLPAGGSLLHWLTTFRFKRYLNHSLLTLRQQFPDKLKPELLGPLLWIALDCTDNCSVSMEDPPQPSIDILRVILEYWPGEGPLLNCSESLAGKGQLRSLDSILYEMQASGGRGLDLYKQILTLLRSKGLVDAQSDGRKRKRPSGDTKMAPAVSRLRPYPF